jgi:methylase of polypeptide subunit release factors
MNDILRDLHRERQQRKQYVETVFEVPGAGQHILVLEKHGECLGSSVWASSEYLTRFLGRRLLELQVAGDALQGSRPLRVLEIGCGVGLPGIFCALQGCNVTLTDKEEVGALRLSSLWLAFRMRH